MIVGVNFIYTDHYSKPFFFCESPAILALRVACVALLRDCNELGRLWGRWRAFYLIYYLTSKFPSYAMTSCQIPSYSYHLYPGLSIDLCQSSNSVNCHATPMFSKFIVGYFLQMSHKTSKLFPCLANFWATSQSTASHSTILSKPDPVSTATYCTPACCCNLDGSSYQSFAKTACPSISNLILHRVLLHFILRFAFLFLLARVACLASSFS